MHMGSISTLKITILAAGAVAERRFVTFGDAQAGLDGAVKGVSEMAAGEAGDALPLTVIGVVDMVAGAAIAAGDEVVSDASGQPIPKAGNTNVAGRALNAAALGGRVSILIR